MDPDRFDYRLLDLSPWSYDQLRDARRRLYAENREIYTRLNALTTEIRVLHRSLITNDDDLVAVSSVDYRLVDLCRRLRANNREIYASLNSLMAEIHVLHDSLVTNDDDLVAVCSAIDILFDKGFDHLFP